MGTPQTPQRPHRRRAASVPVNRLRGRQKIRDQNTTLFWGSRAGGIVRRAQVKALPATSLAPLPPKELRPVPGLRAPYGGLRRTTARSGPARPARYLNRRASAAQSASSGPCKDRRGWTPRTPPSQDARHNTGNARPERLDRIKPRRRAADCFATRQEQSSPCLGQQVAQGNSSRNKIALDPQRPLRGGRVRHVADFQGQALQVSPKGAHNATRDTPRGNDR